MTGRLLPEGGSSWDVSFVEWERGEQSMRRSRYVAEQIAFALRQAEDVTPVEEVWRTMGIAEQTFYRWKRRVG